MMNNPLRIKSNYIVTFYNLSISMMNGPLSNEPRYIMTFYNLIILNNTMTS